MDTTLQRIKNIIKSNNYYISIATRYYFSFCNNIKNIKKRTEINFFYDYRTKTIQCEIYYKCKSIYSKFNYYLNISLK